MSNLLSLLRGVGPFCHISKESGEICGFWQLENFIRIFKFCIFVSIVLCSNFQMRKIFTAYQNYAKQNELHISVDSPKLIDISCGTWEQIWPELPQVGFNRLEMK